MSTQPRRFSRRYWLGLARFLGLLILVGAAIIGIKLFQMAATLASDALHPPRTPVTKSPTEVGITNYQDIAFQAADGVTLKGWYVPGRNGAAIILGHGNASNRAEMLPEAAILSQGGYGVLLFDWRGTGESGGNLVSFGQYETRDLRAAVDFALAQPGVDPHKIGGLGFSLGGSAMTLGAAQDDRIRAVIIESSFATLDEVAAWRTRNVPLVGALAVQIGQQQAGVDAAQVRPVDAICRISPRPVLLIYGVDDDYIPPDSGEEMFAAACDPKELWSVEGVGHGGFAAAQPEAYARRIVAFFDANLSRP